MQLMSLAKDLLGAGASLLWKLTLAYVPPYQESACVEEQ